MTKKKVLFLGHEATRTGAPLLMLETIRWLLKNSTFQPEIFLERGGEIEQEYSEIAPTFCPRGRSQSIIRKALRRLRLLGDNPNLQVRYPVEAYPVVYANTIATCQTAMTLAGPDRRIIQHIHEMRSATDNYQAKEILREAVRFTDAYIAVSHAVKDYLTDVIHVPAERISIIPGFPIAGRIKGSESDQGQSVRQKHGIPEDAFVIGMCGSPCWRKGTDVFLRLVQEVGRIEEGKRCHFLWLGGHAGDFREMQFDIDKLGLGNVCHFAPAVEDPGPYFDAFDLFALTSREDPFPLVMLEAASVGLPVVCFEGSGGASELVETDAGMVVPYLDVEAMARACLHLMQDERMLRQLGDRAKWKVDNLYLLEHQGPKIRAVIESEFEQNQRV